jgi:hypothetical protein
VLLRSTTDHISEMSSSRRTFIDPLRKLAPLLLVAVLARSWLARSLILRVRSLFHRLLSYAPGPRLDAKRSPIQTPLNQSLARQSTWTAQGWAGGEIDNSSPLRQRTRQFSCVVFGSINMDLKAEAEGKWPTLDSPNETSRGKFFQFAVRSGGIRSIHINTHWDPSCE